MCHRAQMKRGPLQFHDLFHLHLTYLRPVETAVNVDDRLVPTAVTAVIMTTAIRAAINPYSIAVAPHSSMANSLSSLSIVLVLVRIAGESTAFSHRGMAPKC